MNDGLERFTRSNSPDTPITAAQNNLNERIDKLCNLKPNRHQMSKKEKVGIALKDSATLNNVSTYDKTSDSSNDSIIYREKRNKMSKELK